MDDSKWGRWFWKDKKALGRWHAIARSEVPVTVDGKSLGPVGFVLACGRVRVRPPKLTGARPETAQCCPTCRELDDLRLSYLNQHKPVAESTLVTA